MKKKSELNIAWSNAVNDKTNWSYKDARYGNKVTGKLRAMHYICYNIARGLPIDRGFQINKEFDSLVFRLDTFISRTLIRNNEQVCNKWIREAYINFFDNTITVDEFVEKANEALRLYSNS